MRAKPPCKWSWWNRVTLELLWFYNTHFLIKFCLWVCLHLIPSTPIPPFTSKSMSIKLPGSSTTLPFFLFQTQLPLYPSTSIATPNKLHTTITNTTFINPNYIKTSNTYNSASITLHRLANMSCGGYYKYSCAHRFTYNCMGTVWVNGSTCSDCLVSCRLMLVPSMISNLWYKAKGREAPAAYCKTVYKDSSNLEKKSSKYHGSGRYGSCSLFSMKICYFISFEL